MRRPRTHRIVAAVAATAASLLSLPAAANVTVEGAWIGAPPPGATTAAAYATFSNSGADEVAIVGAQSDCCERIEFHETSMTDGIARMRRQPALVIPPGGSLRLDPSGTHLMLIRPTPLEAGERVTIRFASDAHTEWIVEFEIRGRPSEPESAHEHHHHTHE